MADALKRCERTTIIIATDHGPMEVKAWRLGDFACHIGVGPQRSVWVVTFVPKGMCLSSKGVFSSEDDAANAMEQIAAEGDWTDLSGPNLHTLGEMTRRVFAAHKAALLA